jgi:hypothetical protein
MAPTEGTSITRRRFVNRRGPEIGKAAARGIGGSSGGVGGIMGRWRLWIILALVVVLAIVGGLLYLAFGDFPVPAKPVEKVLPNDRFPR